MILSLIQTSSGNSVIWLSVKMEPSVKLSQVGMLLRGHTTSVAHWLEEDDFRKNGGVMNHETTETMSKRKKPFTVDYTGFGWVMIKNGVFELSLIHI